MQNWEITKNRAQLSLTVWEQLMPTLLVGTLGTVEYTALIALFEPRAQACAVKQDDADACYRGQKASLLILKILGVKVPQLIEGHLSENELLMKDLKDVFRISPRSEGAILDRARALYPLWVRANAARAAQTPPQPPITRLLQGVAQTAEMFKTRLDAYTEKEQETSNANGFMKAARQALHEVDEDTDQLNKSWYKVARGMYDPGSPEAGALDGIPTETGTPAPDTIEMNPLEQGGENGLQVLVSYVAGGGDHATTRLVKHQIVGVDPGFDHSAPLDPSGNALGPFTVGQTVRVITEVSNSAGTRTTAARTIEIAVPI